MNIPTVAISVDCVSASQGKCFVSELVSVAEQFLIPLTWLIDVSEHEPLTNVKLYHDEYLHRIPSWHEIGLHLSYDNSASNTVARGDLIRVGKDLLKQYSIKPTAFRAANGDLSATDIKALEDCGILVDSTPGSSAGRPQNSPVKPYHPSYELVNQEGDAKLWIIPVANVNGVRGYLDDGFDRLLPVLEKHLASSDVLSLGMSDCVDNRESLRKTLTYLKEKGARFTTLTHLVSSL